MNTSSSVGPLPEFTSRKLNRFGKPSCYMKPRKKQASNPNTTRAQRAAAGERRRIYIASDPITGEPLIKPGVGILNVADKVRKGPIKVWNPAVPVPNNQPDEHTIFSDDEQLKKVQDLFANDPEGIPASPSDMIERVLRVAWSRHPRYGIPRCMVAFLRLEQEAYSGDSKAMQIYLERTLGKQPDKVVIDATEFDKKSDKELLDAFSGDEALGDTVTGNMLKLLDIATTQNSKVEVIEPSKTGEGKVAEL